MRTQLDSKFETFETSLRQPSPVSVRLNPAKYHDHFEETEKTPWCVNGRYLPHRPNFTLDPLFHAGTYYVQEASSMSLAHILRSVLDLERPVRYLDLSAAPGGKATLINALMSSDSVLVANEVVPKRNKVLQQNLARWGYNNTIVTQSDPKYFRKVPETFDCILVDAPCSGEGLFRKDPRAMEEWSEENVQLCAARQKRILADIYPALAPGGILIYSTCTFSAEENEDNVKWLLGQSDLDPVAIHFPLDWGIQQASVDLPAYRFYPHKLRGEGFFISVFRRQGSAAPDTRRSPAPSRLFASADAEDGKWLIDPGAYHFLTMNRYRLALPKHLTTLYSQIQGALRITSAGISIGKLYPNGLQPAAELAFSLELSPDVPRVEMGIQQARKFLAHEALELPPDLDPARYLVTYKGFGLGWINKLRNDQVRNNYPLSWRILNQ